MAEWYVHHGGKTHGPFSAAQMKHLAASKQITPATNVRLGAEGKWTPAQNVRGLFEAAQPSEPAVSSFSFPDDPAETEADPFPIPEPIPQSQVVSSQRSAASGQSALPPELQYTGLRYNRHTDTFSGTMAEIVKLAMRAVQSLGWKLDQVDKDVGFVSFQTSISWGSWSGVSCSLNIEEVSPNTFRVDGSGKQNVRGGQILAMNLFGEAQSKARKAIEKMKELAT